MRRKSIEELTDKELENEIKKLEEEITSARATIPPLSKAEIDTIEVKEKHLKELQEEKRRRVESGKYSPKS